jgi:Zn-dependent protease with chaperone function
MSVMLLLLLALVSMQPHWPETPLWLTDLLGPAGPLVATLGCITLVWTLGSFCTWLCCRDIRREPEQARRLLRHFHSRQRFYFLLLTGAFLASLYFLGWGKFVYPDKQQISLPGSQFALMAPFLAGLVFSWLRFYDPERLLHRIEAESRALLRALAGDNSGPSEPPFLSRMSYLGLQVRFNLVLIAPPLFLMFLRETFLWAVPATRNSEAFEPVFFMGFLGLALLGMPWMLRVFLGLKPLPAGPLRDRLEATIHRLRFRFSAILLWDTRNSSANAMVTGILPWPRYIVLTDQLLRDLSPDEVEAVIGHEIGHVKHHHMFFYMMFLFASLISLGLLWEICKAFLQTNYVPGLAPWLTETFELISAFPPLLGVSLYLFVVFGYLSRYCETQADIFGSRTISSEVFISALEKVAVLNGIPRENPGWLSTWRHPTIANRVNFLRRMGEDPALERQFQWRIGLFKWSLALTLSAILAALLVIAPRENEPPREQNGPRQQQQ